jgi:beta-lactamase regulating signal transducer with metallopeptidase domain
MSAHILLEAALRTLVMGAIIVLALRALRIEQVRARRTAWLLALAGALAMPVLVAAQVGPRLLPDLSASLSRPQLVEAPAGPTAATDESRGFQVTSSIAGRIMADTKKESSGLKSAGLANIALSLGLLCYCAVAAVLCLRLCAGVGFAWRLRHRSERIRLSFDPGLDVRVASRLTTPVTIGRSVLLPPSYASWDEATLRIVLSHERAHVRQGDFYVHALAGLHCALFWFNPFSWWLKRQLSELGEALSDCAAVEQAESRTSYAEILLAFATRAQTPMAGVAMASAGNLTSRIERLLSDRGFERSFARQQRLPFIAAGVVMMALAASTSMVRVHAAPAIEIHAVAASEPAVSALAASLPVASAPAPSTPVPSTPAPSAPVASPQEPAPVPNDTAPAPTGQKAKKSTNQSGAKPAHEAGGGTADDGVIAIHTDHSNFMINSGDQLPQQSGDYIYFQHNGKPYLIEDPQIIAKAQTLLAPMKELGEQQKMLGHQQALLGAQQRMLVAQSRAFKFVDSPEFKREMADVEKSIKDMKLPELTAKIDQQVLAEIQAHLGEIQARVGRMQSEFGSDLGKFGEQQGKLGEQQGKLGEQQALLGEQQRKIIEDVRRQLEPLIEQAIREGRARVLVN